MGAPAALEETPSDGLVGRTIAGKYVVEAALGVGAMGAVYRARQVALERTVAIKVMASELATTPDFVARFHREAKAASRLGHPSSIGVTDFGEEPDGLLYLVMEFVPGRNLDVLIQEDFPLSPRRIASMLAQILSAVAAAHDLGIVHRDLKPENVLVVPTTDDEGHPADTVKVCDFGIATMMGQGDGLREDGPPKPSTASARKLTAVGAILGTPAYMSPEQVRGLPPDARSDLYAVGGMLYEMLTQRIPFDLASTEELLLAHLNAAPRDPRELVPTCDPGLAEICMQALRKEPGERFQTARAMLSAIRRAVTALPPGSTSMAAAADADARALPRDVSLGALPAAAVGAQETLTAPAPARGRRAWVIGAVAALAVAGGVAALFVAAGARRAESPQASPPVRAAAPPAALASLAPSVTTRPPGDGPPPARERSAPEPAPSNAAGTGSNAAGTGSRSRAAAVGGRAKAGAAEPAIAVGVAAAPPAVAEGAAAPAAAAPAAAAPAAEVAAPPIPATSPPAAAPAFNPDGARVKATVVAVTGTPRSALVTLLAHVSFTSCYVTALRGLGRAEAGRGTMRLDIDEDGVVRGAAVRLPPALAGATACFTSRIHGQRLPSAPDTGTATAELALELAP